MPDGRPLVVRFGAIGDMILVTPILRALAVRHGQRCDVLGRGGYLAPLFRGLPWVGEVRAINHLRTHRWFEPSKRAAERWLRARAPGPVYLLQDDSAVRSLLRYGKVPGEPVCERGLTPIANEHVVERYARLCGLSDAGRLAVDPACAPHAELAVLPDEAADCAAWLGGLGISAEPLVLLQPGNRKTSRWRGPADDPKWWPEDRWAAVASGVLEQVPGARVLLVGSPNEQALAEDIRARSGSPHVLAVADRLPLRRLFALMQRAHSLISVDTGPAHAAAALDCPSVVLFGASDPRVNRGRPRRAPLIVLDGARDPAAPKPDGRDAWAAAHALDAIAPSDVLAAFTRVRSQLTGG
jgi:heptosyltransferase-2/heptosyltransferase-3